MAIHGRVGCHNHAAATSRTPPHHNHNRLHPAVSLAIPSTPTGCATVLIRLGVAAPGLSEQQQPPRRREFRRSAWLLFTLCRAARRKHAPSATSQEAVDRSPMKAALCS